jgi:hypothetical protein
MSPCHWLNKDMWIVIGNTALGAMKSLPTQIGHRVDHTTTYVGHMSCSGPCCPKFSSISALELFHLAVFEYISSTLQSKTQIYRQPSLDSRTNTSRTF